MAALAAEIAHQQLRSFLAANGVKRGALPKPLEIPRPGRPSRTAAGRRRAPAGRPKARSVDEVVAVLTAAHTARG